MDRKQAFFLEGVRVSLEMIDLAHERLRKVLFHVSQQSWTVGGQLGPGAFTSALLDAWSIVDALHRLHGLIQHLPGISKRRRIPAIRFFLENSQQVEVFRNTVQHLSETIQREPLDGKWAVWGTLSWFWVYGENQMRAYTFLSGRIEPGTRTVFQALPMNIEVPIGLIKLSQGDASICISELLSDVRELAAELHRHFGAVYESRADFVDRYPADILIALDLEARPRSIEDSEPGGL